MKNINRWLHGHKLVSNNNSTQQLLIINILTQQN